MEKGNELIMMRKSCI